MAYQCSSSSRLKTAAMPFDLHVDRVPVKSWGCTSIESSYVKKYKVGQGSYGFE